MLVFFVCLFFACLFVFCFVVGEREGEGRGRVVVYF